MASKRPSPLTCPTKVLRSDGQAEHNDARVYTLTNSGETQSAIVLDYGRAEGGVPVFEVSTSSGPSEISFRVIYSETCDGVDSETGDGPYFLFSNAMDTYRSVVHTIQPSHTSQVIESRYTQRSQRYQKLVLLSSESSVTFSHIGFRKVRPEAIKSSTFNCSNEKLNRIWLDGVQTVDMCTVVEGETAKAWDVTEGGTRVYGQHWAPCRQGTRWTDKTVTFEVKVELGGASWGVHMVANGLIFCLDTEEWTLKAFEGLADKSAVFPTIPHGTWTLPGSPDSAAEWFSVETSARGSSVTVAINGRPLARIDDLNIHPILGGSSNNSGSVAFGGPASWIALYRSLKVMDKDGRILYANDFSLADEARTLADFAVGTNNLPCTIDGAKRDRAVFGGDLHAMGRSIYYSTMNLEAAAGSIKLLTSHQTKDGYLGNLCPIQAPVHTEAEEPPTYAFYSLGYSLLLIVAAKDYWMHSADGKLVAEIWDRFDKLLDFVESFVNEQGLVVAPPPLSMTWFPMGGPIFGASGHINLAYYDALKAMASMTSVTGAGDRYTKRAETLKDHIVEHLYISKTGILKMSDHSPEDGLSQDVNAYSISLGVSPLHVEDERTLTCQNSTLPLAFERIERWEQLKVVSPYATGFAVEACFERGLGRSAVDLLERVWGYMADQSQPNYSGGHWEAMTVEGKPFHKDTSLVHGWSTWPVHLLPRYLAGLHPIKAGWKRWAVKPVLAGLDAVDVVLETVSGQIKVSLKLQEAVGAGSILLTVPIGTEADVYAPHGWRLADDDQSRVIVGRGAEVEIKIEKCSRDTSQSTATERSPANSDDAVNSKQLSVVVTSIDQSWLARQLDTLRSAWAWLSRVVRSVGL